MKKLAIVFALLCGAPVAAAQAQNYEELADVNIVATTASAPAPAVAVTEAQTPARPRSVRIASAPRSLTVAMAHAEPRVVLASAGAGF